MSSTQAVLAFVHVRRALGAKTAAWLRAVDAIPSTPPLLTPYRG
ncbi:MAG: hypothetical protein U0270_27275 [Labilithrix sp.]